MTTGSHNQQIYWYATGNSRILGQLPAIWLTADRRWIPRRAAVMRPPGGAHVSETGGWNGICVACHTTNGQPQLDTPLGSQPILTQTADTRATEFGIACESCHGPSDAHARANRNPLRRYASHLTGARRSRRSSSRRSCRRRARRRSAASAIRSGSSPIRQSERRANAHGLPYRPGRRARGDALHRPADAGTSTRRRCRRFSRRTPASSATSSGPTAWCAPPAASTTASSSRPASRTRPTRRGRCRASRATRCTRRRTTRGRSSEWAERSARAARARATARACNAIRARVPRDSAAHTRHRADSSGSSCYNCHMPFTTYGLLKTIRSHQISSPSVQSTLATGRPNACNLCHLDKTLAWTAQYLERLVRRGEAGARRRRELGGGVGARAAQGRRRPARDRRAEHGLGGGAAGVGHARGWRRTWR